MRKGTKKFSLCKNYRGLKRTEGRSGRNGTDGSLRRHSSRSALRRRPQNVGHATALAEVRSLRPEHRRTRRRSRNEDAPCVSWVSQNATGSSPPPCGSLQSACNPCRPAAGEPPCRTQNIRSGRIPGRLVRTGTYRSAIRHPLRSRPAADKKGRRLRGVRDTNPGPRSSRTAGFNPQPARRTGTVARTEADLNV